MIQLDICLSNGLKPPTSWPFFGNFVSQRLTAVFFRKKMPVDFETGSEGAIFDSKYDEYFFLTYTTWIYPTE